MATLLDRANLLAGNAYNAQYLSEPNLFGDNLKAVFPTGVDQIGVRLGIGRSYTGPNGANSYAFTNPTVDASGNVFLTLQTIGQPAAGYPVRPPVSVQVIGADANFTLLAQGTNPVGGGYQNYFLLSNTSLNGNAVTFPITDLSTSGFSNTAGSIPPNDTAIVGYPPCFHAGTRLLAEHGEVAVEDIAPGMLLRVAGGGLRPVMWVGDMTVNVAAQPDPVLAAPVRIRAGAFADAVPARDLVVSPDHAIWTHAALVPAHLLVNGGSIVQDAAAEAHYYHVELDQHDLVIAEGLTAESYLDNGKRGLFGGARVSVLNAPFASGPEAYAALGYAKLSLDEATVRPIWAALAARAAMLGMGAALDASTHDPALRLEADGVVIAPIAGPAPRFAIPAGTTEVTLVSRAARPSDTRPWLDDRRTLGVLVGSIGLVAGGARHEVALDDDAVLSRGWWSVEQAGPGVARWTDGRGVIALPPVQGDAVLEFVLVGEMAYPVRLAA